MKTIFTSQASKELRHNDLEALGDDIPTVTYPCEHYQYCRVRQFGRINCLTKDSIETCNTKRYYNKYGDYGNQLGIGATT